MKKHKKLWIVLGTILIIFIGIFIGLAIYVNDYYHAETTALSSLESDESVQVLEEKNYYVFKPKSSYDTGIIFYPGAKVEETAYAPLLKKLAEEGYLCILIKMPFRLAILDTNAASKVAKDSQVKKWYMAGHSLGGAMASTYISKHSDEYMGLILFAAYSQDNISQTNLKVLSLYGEHDEVLNKNKYESCIKNLPSDYVEHIIHGGCHAYFGTYGLQNGDGNPTITNEEQINLAIYYIRTWLEGV